MNNEKIANRQLLFILFMMRTTIIIAFLPVLRSADALQDAWISAIVAFFGAGALVTIFATLGQKYPEQTIVEYSQLLLGKWAGRGLCLVFVLAFLVIASTDTRFYAEAIVGGFLTETPLLVITGMMLVLAGVAAFAGVEVIGRCADILLPLFLLGIVFSLAASMPTAIQMRWNLEPVLARGIAPVIRGSIIPSVMIVQYFVVTMLLPNTLAPQRVLATSLWALAGVTVILSITAAQVVAVLGPHRGMRQAFPFFALVRTIQISAFLERLEILMMFAWGFGVFLGVSTVLLCLSLSLSQILGMQNYRPLVAPLTVICIVFALHAYDDVFQIRSFFSPQLGAPYIASWVLMPMGILWAAHLLRSRKGRDGNDKS